MWAEIPLTLRFTTPLCGGVPRNDDIVQRWVQVRQATEAAHRKMVEAPPGPEGKTIQSLEEVAAERAATTDILPEDADEQMSKVWVGFSRDEQGLFVRGANIRAHLKDCAGVLARAMRLGHIDGLKTIGNFRAKFVDSVYVQEGRIHILDADGKTYNQPAGYRDATLSVMTAQGPRTCLKRIDFCDRPVLRCTIQLYTHSEINRDHLVACLEYGSVHGFGQDRSLQYGRYTYELGE